MLKDHNAVKPVRLEPTASRSRVKHSTTEPLHSLLYLVIYCFENTADPDQLAPKPADQDQYCLPLYLQILSDNIDRRLTNFHQDLCAFT